MYQLTDDLMCQALDELSLRDTMLASLYQEFGAPPLWGRPQSFATLVHIILEQKVSLASAQAVMSRVHALCPGMKPADFLTISDEPLREAGLSARKVTYCRSIALSLVDGSLSLARLRKLDDQAVIDKLVEVRGIGPWTAGVYLMMALRRSDAWASGDRALVVSYAECAQLDVVPSYPELDLIAQNWMPYRGTAARLLWHAYLAKRNRSQEAVAQ